MSARSCRCPLLLVAIVALAAACAPVRVRPPASVAPPTATQPPSPLPTPAPTEPAVPSRYTYRVLNTYPHDPGAYTQGLAFLDGSLYEGTGRLGQSSLRKVDLETGQILQAFHLAGEYYGEGIVLWGDRILQLTWKSRIGFVYDRASFRQLRTFAYGWEGWGITHDGRRLIASDGTSTLHFLDPDSLTETGRVYVWDDRGPVTQLNELEYIRGEVWANVWQTDWIARIDPATGRVTGWIDLAGLLSPAEAQAANVLNGIAYDMEDDRVFVTGKYWPRLFEIRVEPAP